jgi:hypothetical protein
VVDIAKELDSLPNHVTWYLIRSGHMNYRCDNINVTNKNDTI